MRADGERSPGVPLFGGWRLDDWEKRKREGG
jgi:hypothetical protein